MSDLIDVLYGEMNNVEKNPQAKKEALAKMAEDSITTYDWDKYAKDANEYLKRPAFKGTALTGEMLASSARKAYETTGKILPVEFVLSQGQFETMLGKNLKSSNNFFNYGNFDDVVDNKGRVIKKGQVVHFDTPQKGVDAYYNLMANNYLVNKTPDDLLKNFVNTAGNRYASDPQYENKIKGQIQHIRGGKWRNEIQQPKQEKTIVAPPITTPKKQEPVVTTTQSKRERFNKAFQDAQNKGLKIFEFEGGKFTTQEK